MKISTKVIVAAFLFIPISNQLLAQSYITYPLNLGDYWQYEVEELYIYQSYEVIGDTTFLNNGLTYKVLQRDSGSKIYRRFFEDKVYHYNNNLQEDQILYDFTLQPGDTVAVFPHENDTLIITLIDIRYNNIFGLDRKQWLFLFDYIPYIDDEVVFTITDSIGFTSADNIWEHYKLVGAIINGTTYGTIVSAKDYGEVIPRLFVLTQNYPNPFNPATKIKYQIPELSFVTLKVYDVLGNETVTLVNGEKQIGSYELEFNAKHSPSGVYFYRLEAGSFVETKKMVLLR
jgi:hypothetical protein